MRITYQKAIEAKNALQTLAPMNLPIKTSLEIALLACAIEKQVEACVKVRDTLLKNYKIKLGIGDKPGEVTFSTTGDTEKLREDTINEFVSKMNELMASDTEDIVGKIHLPSNISVSPEVLKPLIPFVELIDV